MIWISTSGLSSLESLFVEKFSSSQFIKVWKISIGYSGMHLGRIMRRILSDSRVKVRGLTPLFVQVCQTEQSVCGTVLTRRWSNFFIMLMYKLSKHKADGLFLRVEYWTEILHTEHEITCYNSIMYAGRRVINQKLKVLRTWTNRLNSQQGSWLVSPTDFHGYFETWYSMVPALRRYI